MCDRRCILFVVLAISMSLSESKTPFTQTGHSARVTQIDDFNIEGCNEEYCELKEEEPYKFNITFITRAEGIGTGVSIFYELTENVRTNIITSTAEDNMPKFCENLVGDNQCPLKVNESATYSASIKISAPVTLWGLTTSKKLILKIKATLDSSELKPLVSFIYVNVPITLKRCWPFCF